MLSKENIKEINKLYQAKYRNLEQKFIVEGLHLVNEAKAKNLLLETYTIDQNIEGILITENEMRKICKTDTVCKALGICKLIDKHSLSNKILLLDAVQDPGNLGALMRSAYAFGFETIVLGDGCVDIYNDKVIRTSQGAIFKLNFIKENLVTFINEHKEYKIYGTNVKRGIDLKEVEKVEKLGIVLGNEGNGISDKVDSVIEKNIYIKLNNTESLNVNIAGSIIMYELS